MTVLTIKVEVTLDSIKYIKIINLLFLHKPPIYLDVVKFVQDCTMNHAQSC